MVMLRRVVWLVHGRSRLVMYGVVRLMRRAVTEAMVVVHEAVS